MYCCYPYDCFCGPVTHLSHKQIILWLHVPIINTHTMYPVILSQFTFPKNFIKANIIQQRMMGNFSGIRSGNSMTEHNFQISLAEPSLHPCDLLGWLKVAEKN